MKTSRGRARDVRLVQRGGVDDRLEPMLRDRLASAGNPIGDRKGLAHVRLRSARARISSTARDKARRHADSLWIAG